MNTPFEFFNQNDLPAFAKFSTRLVIYYSQSITITITFENVQSMTITITFKNFKSVTITLASITFLLHSITIWHKLER